MTYCITLQKVTNKLSEIVPNPCDQCNKLCSKQKHILHKIRSRRFKTSIVVLYVDTSFRIYIKIGNYDHYYNHYTEF